MSWLHTWAGLVAGWILFAVFLTGTLSYFQHEISRWMQPELKPVISAELAMEQAQHYLQNHGADADNWIITVPGQRGLTTNLFWRGGDAQNNGLQRVSLDGNGLSTNVRETRGGSFLYRFHFDLYHMPVRWARWIVGVCSMFMLVTLLTGIIIHKKIFKDFFSLKWHKGHRSWLDAHTLTSVLALPFHLMTTYTGLVTLLFMYMGLAVSANVDNTQAFFNQLSGRAETIPASGQKAPLVPLKQIYQQATDRLDGADIAGITVSHPGDASARVAVREAGTSELISGFRLLTYSGVSGELLTDHRLEMIPEQIRRTMINLHSGRFADPALRWLYFLSGLLGTAMIGTGLLLWSSRRKAKHAASQSMPAGHRLVDGLNAGTVLGLPLAITAYFWANRLLPIQLPARAEWEIHCFFAIWLLVLLYSILRSQQRIWHQLLFVLAIGLGGLPILNLITTQSHLLQTLPAGDWVIAGFDLCCLLSGAICLQAALRLKARGNSRAGNPAEVKLLEMNQ